MKLYNLAIMVLFCLGILTMHTARGSVGSQIIRRSSCINLSTKELDIRGLANYENQNIPVKAVMFITKGGIKICVEPELKWVKQAIKYLDQRRVIKKTIIN
uniref:Chemokine interleukin-8-like domain-containing protein n=1 Tax=Crocodylus porosus TaxID=8502 RepID=A0A7M4E858_CROPO